MSGPSPFKYQIGLCLQCDAPIDPGQIFCSAHTQLDPVPTDTKREKDKSKNKKSKLPDTQTTVSDMIEGQIGYIEEYAIFEEDRNFHIISTKFVVPEPRKYQTVKVRYLNGQYEISRDTISLNEVYFGIPNIADNVICYIVKIVDKF